MDIKQFITRQVKSIFSRENLEVVITAVILALIIRAFVVQAFKIPTGSMRETLLEGDRILVNKFIYRFTEPKRWDIVVFKYPEDKKKDFIKRLVALGGETVEIKGGNIWINSKLAEKPSYIQHIYYYNKPATPFGEEGVKITVPKGHYFVLGDNSASSRDSRYWGFVPKKYMIGKPMVIFWPVTRIRVLK